MKLDRLQAQNYRSLRDVDLELRHLNLLIGANASGKSNVLDALRFLAQGVQEKEFTRAVGSRGGMVQLAWKGTDADFINLKVSMAQEQQRYEWQVRIDRQGFDYEVTEDVRALKEDAPPSQLLHSQGGKGWWWSGSKKQTVNFALPANGCALAAASVDEFWMASRSKAAAPVLRASPPNCETAAARSLFGGRAIARRAGLFRPPLQRT